MRAWRFDENGIAKDAVTFDDTYMLYDLADSAFLDFACASIGICYKEKHDSQIRLDAIQKLKGSFRLGYDYACVFQKAIFPVKDDEVRTIICLKLAMQDRIDKGLCWKYF